MDHRDWKAEAANALRQPNYSPRKMVLLHTGAVAAASILLSLISLVIGLIADRAGGGLSGMGMQTMLATLQTTLPLLVLLAQPFWSVGIQQAALNYGDNRDVSVGDLLGGFRRWKPIVTSSLMIGVVYMGRIFIASFLAGQIMTFTPFAGDILAAAEAQMENPEMDIFALLGDKLIPFVITYGAVFMALFAAFALPVYYRYRFVNYILLDQPAVGGMQAMFISRMMTQGRRKALFKLDLSFWWFFLMELLVGALGYGEILLELTDVKLPLSPAAMGWAFLLLSLGAQLALHCFAKAKVEVSWARAYRNCSMPTMDPAGFRDVVDADSFE